MIRLDAPAKINLFLQTTGKRDDGYHFIESIMQTVDLCDEVFLELTDEDDITLTCSDNNIPVDDRNIAVKAAKSFFEYTGVKCGIKIHIEKKIPSFAGMGGGSADGAAVIVGLNKLLSLNLSIEDMVLIGAKVGADIPFLIHGGTAVTKGIGEVITPIKKFENAYFVIVKPDVSIDTKSAYGKLDELKDITKKDINDMILAIESEYVEDIGKLLYNEFEFVAPTEIGTIKQMLKEYGAINSLMTGSGSAVFGVFSDYDKARRAKERLEEVYDKVLVCKPKREY